MAGESTLDNALQTQEVYIPPEMYSEGTLYSMMCKCKELIVVDFK